MIVFDEAGECWDSGDCESEPKNKLNRCGEIAGFYLLSDMLLKLFQIYEIRFIYGLPLTFWHASTAMFDVMVFVVGWLAIYVVRSGLTSWS